MGTRVKERRSPVKTLAHRVCLIERGGRRKEGRVKRGRRERGEGRREEVCVCGEKEKGEEEGKRGGKTSSPHTTHSGSA